MLAVLLTESASMAYSDATHWFRKDYSVKELARTVLDSRP